MNVCSHYAVTTDDVIIVIIVVFQPSRNHITDVRTEKRKYQHHGHCQHRKYSGGCGHGLSTVKHRHQRQLFIAHFNGVSILTFVTTSMMLLLALTQYNTVCNKSFSLSNVEMRVGKVEWSSFCVNGKSPGLKSFPPGF